MRTGLSAIAAARGISIQWVFECDGNYWTFGNDVIYGGNTYTSRVVSDSFTGISEKNTDYINKLIAPNTTNFSITGAKIDFTASDFKGEDVLITLLVSGAKAYAWRFYVKSCYYQYGKFNFECEDFLQKYLFSNYYPNTTLLNSYNNTDASFAGSENAVVPEVFGTAYAPLRAIPSGGYWYYVLGADSGTYTISEYSSPVDFEQKSTYTVPTYDATQSTISGLKVYANNIGPGGDNAPFGKSGKLYDLPTKYSNSATVTTTAPADIISHILQALGVPVAQIDVAGTFATHKTKTAAAGITYQYSFTTKEDAVEVLIDLLQSCNSDMPRSDVVQLIMKEEGTSVKTIDRENILNLNFSEKIYNTNFESGTAYYYPNIQAGSPSELPVNIIGSGGITPYPALEHDTDIGLHNSLVMIDSTHFILAYQGTGSFGYIKTFAMDATTKVFTEIDSLLHEGTEGAIGGQSMIKIDSTHFALAYKVSATNTGVIKVFSIDGSYNNITQESTVSWASGFDINVATGFHLIDSTHFLLTYTGFTDGWATTFVMDPVTFAVTVVNSYEFDPTEGFSASSAYVSPGVYVVGWQGNSNGKVSVLTVDGSYVIAEPSTYTHNAGDAFHNSVCVLDSSHFVLAYDDDSISGNGWIKVFNIGASPTYTITLVAAFARGMAIQRYNSLVTIDSTHFALAYEGENSDGFLKTFEFNGVDTITEQYTYEFDTVNGTYNSLIAIDSTHYALAYQGSGLDGFIRAFEILLPTYPNMAPEKVLYKYTTDTQVIQQLATIYFRRKFLETGTLSFTSNHSMLEPYLGDKLTITDSNYEDYANVYVDSITIKPDLKFEFTLDAYSESIGDLSDYSPPSVTKTVDTSDVIPPKIVVVDSADGAGIEVDAGGDIVVKSGGDIYLFGSATDQSKIYFYDEETVATSTGSLAFRAAPSSYGYTDDLALIIEPELGTCSFSIGAEANRIDGGHIKATSYASVVVSDDSGSPISYYTGFEAGNGQLTIKSNNSTDTGIMTMLAGAVSAEDYVSITMDSGTPSCKLIVGDAGVTPNTQSIEMTSQIEIRRGIRKMGTETTYDSLIPATGDRYNYASVDGVPMIRYRHSDGNCYSIAD